MTRYILSGLAAAIATAPMLFDAGEAAAEAPAEVAAKKSIVPAKYSGKYKGSADVVAEFINGQASGKEGFEFEAFFALCRANGIDEAKVKHYSDQVFEEKRHGAKGRARMTLGNMLRAIARKNGKLVGLNGEETELAVAKAPVTGAAAKAQETAASAAETEQSTSDEQAAETDGTETDSEDTE